MEAAVSALVGRVSSLRFHRCSLIIDYQYIFLQFVLCAFIYYVWLVRSRIANTMKHSDAARTEMVTAVDAAAAGTN